MAQLDQETLQQRLGEALSRLRERGGLTREELAQAMGEGSSFAERIGLWEGGRSAPPGDQLWRYLAALDLSFSDLDLELGANAENPRLRELAAKLDAMGRR